MNTRCVLVILCDVGFDTQCQQVGSLLLDSSAGDTCRLAWTHEDDLIVNSNSILSQLQVPADAASKMAPLKTHPAGNDSLGYTICVCMQKLVQKLSLKQTHQTHHTDQQLRCRH